MGIKARPRRPRKKGVSLKRNQRRGWVRQDKKTGKYDSDLIMGGASRDLGNAVIYETKSLAEAAHWSTSPDSAQISRVKVTIEELP